MTFAMGLIALRLARICCQHAHWPQAEQLVMGEEMPALQREGKSVHCWARAGRFGLHLWRCARRPSMFPTCRITAMVVRVNTQQVIL